MGFHSLDDITVISAGGMERYPDLWSSSTMLVLIIISVSVSTCFLANVLDNY